MPALMSRRAAIGAGAAALATLAAPAIGRAQVAGAALPVLPDLPLVRNQGEVRGHLTAESVDAEIAGHRVELLGYAGQFPGPVIRLCHDETLALAFENRLGEATNLHTHGLRVSPEGDGDDPFRRVLPGSQVAYRHPLRGDPLNGGLHWYHPHLHGYQSAQLYAGLAGPLVVEGPEDPGPSLGPHEEHILVLKDLRLGPDGLGRRTSNDWLMGLEGDVALVNGVVRPELVSRERRLRLRIINASNAKHWRLQPKPAATFSLVALDGRTLHAPRQVSELFLAPGQRVDAVLDLVDGTPLELIDLPVPRRGNPGRRPENVLTIRPPRSGAAPDPLPNALVERAPFAAGEVATERDVVFSLFYINGQLHSAHNHEPMFRPRFGTKEIWEIRNVDTMDHPFHLHTWPFRLLEQNGRPVEGEPVRDTLHVRSGTTARIGIDFSAIAGRSVFHCHIVEHAEKGMMAVLEVTR